MSVSVRVDGIEGVSEIMRDASKAVKDSIVISINDTAKFGHAEIKKRIVEEVNLKPSYIGSKNSGRLKISSYAVNANDSAVISARARGTLMSRFLVSAFKRGSPAKVSIAKSRVSSISNAFLMKLKSGNSGLVKRVKSGRIEGSKGALKIGKNLFLLYAPSVSQIMSSVISNDEEFNKRINDKLNLNFKKQFERLSNG
jgi:hypothetical protein